MTQWIARCAVMVALVAAGCGGTTVTPDDAGTDAARSDVGASDGGHDAFVATPDVGIDGGNDAATLPDAHVDDVGLDAPDPIDTSTPMTLCADGVPCTCTPAMPCVCPPGASCAMGCADGGCRIDCQAGAECDITCVGGCNTTCGVGATCDWTSGGGGGIWCAQDATCSGTCTGGGCQQVCTAAGSSCTIDACAGGCSTWCDDATSECALTCGAGCGLACGSSTSCTSTCDTAGSCFPMDSEAPPPPT